MAGPRNEFYDPVAPETYTWKINHSEAEGPKRAANVSFSGRRGAFGIQAQQGDDEPVILTLQGSILHRSQYKAFWRFKGITNSFRYTDYDGQVYEVAMTGLECTPRRVALNLSDATMKRHVWDYTMTLLVLRFVTGDLADEGVLP